MEPREESIKKSREAEGDKVFKVILEAWDKSPGESGQLYIYPLDSCSIPTPVPILYP